MTESRDLIIQIEDEILVGCYDLLAVFGGESEDHEPEKVVSAILKALVLGIQEDKLIPVYESETEIKLRLQNFVQDPASEVIDNIAEKLASELASSPSFAKTKELAAPDETALPETVSTNTDSVKELAFSDLPEKDVLVKEAKGSATQQKALCKVYSRLPQEQWGSDKAREMYQLLLDATAGL